MHSFDRFWNKVNKTDSCWEWMSSINNKGYGTFWYQGRPVYAHRLAYELTVDKIPNNLCACHHCDNPKCVNPDHLFLGTHKDNIQDASNKGRLRNRYSKLSEFDILEIRNLLASGVSQRMVAKQYSVGVMTINHIVHKRTWAWV